MQHGPSDNDVGLKVIGGLWAEILFTGFDFPYNCHYSGNWSENA